MEFLIVKDGQQLGPFTMDQVNAQLAGGMFDPEDLCWCEGFDDWYPLNQVEGFIVPDTQLAAEVPVPETAVVTAVAEESTAAESAAPASGRRKWVMAVALLLVCGIGFGTYQFVFAKGNLDGLCQVWVELIPEPKAAAPPPKKVTPAHVDKYLKAAQAAEQQRQSLDVVNSHLDLRGDFHFTRRVKGLNREAGDWLTAFTASQQPEPAKRAVIDALRAEVLTNGLQQVDAFGMSSTGQGGMFNHTAMLHHGTNGIGRLWQAAGTNSLALTDMRFMPQHTVMAVHGRLNYANLRQWMATAATRTKGTPWMQSLSASLDAVKKEIPLALLHATWSGEFGLYLTALPGSTFVARHDGKSTSLNTPGVVLVVRFNDDKFGDALKAQLVGKLAGNNVIKPNANASANLFSYQAPELPGELGGLTLKPSICLWGNYVVLASTDALATAVLRQAGGTTTGQMAQAEEWAKLHGSSRTSSGRIAYVPVPNASVVCFVAPGVDQQIAKWEQLPFWKDNASHGLLKALKTVAATSAQGGLRSTVQVIPGGVKLNSRVKGGSSASSMERANTATRVMLSEVLPQLSAEVYRQWARVDLPAPAPEPEPAPSESTDGN